MGGHMKNGPSLVIQGTIIGSLVLALLGWLLAKHIELLPSADVAYAASPTQISEPPAAVGLMQVMPRDGIAAAFECINGPCFASRPTIEELQDPSFNIEYGSQMLAGLIGRLGNMREALKSYGPMDVDYRYADTVLAIFENYR